MMPVRPLGSIKADFICKNWSDASSPTLAQSMARWDGRYAAVAEVGLYAKQSKPRNAYAVRSAGDD